MSLSTVVMAHEKRRGMANQLATALDAPIVWDERNNVWDTGRRALLAHLDTGATHGLVIQDDADAPVDLIDGCEEMLAHVPDGHPVALYMGVARTRPRFPMRRVIRKDRSFAVFPGPWWGVAVIVPTASIPELVAFGDTQDTPNYDHRIARFYESRGIDCYYTLPSLVNHRGVRSLLGRGTGRRALWASRRATGHRWDRGIVTPRLLGLGDFPSTP